MRIFAISDLHLSLVVPFDPLDTDMKEHKPMAVMDPLWREHVRRLYWYWREIVAPEDVVLVAGDISWAMRLEEARYDLEFLGLLPGTIVLIQGNHDYWWQSISQVRRALPPNVHALQNDSYLCGEVAICGSRGWLCPGSAYFKAADEKIYRRELIRLELSLRSVPPQAKEIIVMMHYMPTNEKHDYNDFVALFQQYRVKKVVYGHLHARAHRYRLPDIAWGIEFYLTSADYLQFRPRLISNY